MLGNYSDIANPALADIGGALDIRQKRLDADEAKRKEIRTNQLIAEAIPGLREGSPAHELFKTDPQKALFLAKAAGIPLNAGDQFQAMVDDTHTIANIARNDPEGAIQYASTLSQQRKQLGVDTAKLDSWISLAQQDPGKAVRAMDMADKTFNSDIYRKREVEDRKLSQEDRSLDIQERKLNSGSADGERPYFQPVSTAQGLFAFNARTGKMEKVADGEGKPILKTDADVNLTRDKASAEAEGKNTSENLVDAKKDLSRIEGNADQVVGLVNELLNHPGRDMATGATAWIPKIPGTKQAGFINRFDQIQGDAFLQAFQTLKGGGAITEVEGKKASQAINRMDRAAAKDEFDSAAKDFIDIVETGRARARKAAGQEAPKKDSATSSIDDLVNKYAK